MSSSLQIGYFADRFFYKRFLQMDYFCRLSFLITFPIHLFQGSFYSLTCQPLQSYLSTPSVSFVNPFKEQVFICKQTKFICKTVLNFYSLWVRVSLRVIKIFCTAGLKPKNQLFVLFLSGLQFQASFLLQFYCFLLFRFTVFLMK